MVRSRRPRVLIVDDDPAVGRSLARVLATEASVDIAASSADALDKIQRGESFDLIVCDVMMPGMSGPQLFERVRALDPRMAAAFVFVTGGASREEESRMHATGARWLAKPLAMATVRQLLERIP
jgi:CheY-like chemotaxis protein